MRRRSLASLLSDEEQELDEVWKWYEFQRMLIGEEKSRVLDALSGGSADVAPRYFGKARDELEDDFTHQARELGRVTCLGLFACTEAALRVDFIVRVKTKKKDTVSRAFRDSHRARKKIRLEQDILDEWKKHGSIAKTAVAAFKGVLHFRNWLAHGRYWKPKLERAAGYDPVDVFRICRTLLEAADLA